MIVVIFGITGDLAYRKLIPALYALKGQKMLPEKFHILGVGRDNDTDSSIQKKLMDGVQKFSEETPVDKETLKLFTGGISYFRMDMTLADDYLKLKSNLEKMDRERGTNGNYLFYLAMPPGMFGIISDNLGESGLSKGDGRIRRLIVEKPFGYDLDTGLQLNAQLHKSFDENQIFRIDHYLGKETVQNLLVMRFANGIFEPLWNRNYVHHVEITSAESIGVEGRGGYYDHTGALRDMLQNHLLQVVGLTAMEPPSSMEPDAIRNEIFKVFQSFKPLTEKDVATNVIRGQYMTSEIDGVTFPGYREEVNVDPSSRTETFVAMKFYIDNWRWGGVPFYIRTGKRLPTRVTEIVVHFKPTPHTLFMNDPACIGCNQLIIRVQPDEGILIKFSMKEPGAGFKVKTANMDFRYADLADVHLPTAYERLLYDAMMGDSTLYARADAVEAAWRFVAPVQKAWENDKSLPVYGYPAGTWGPKDSDMLIEDSLTGWRYPCTNLTEDGSYCEL